MLFIMLQWINDNNNYYKMPELLWWNNSLTVKPTDLKSGISQNLLVYCNLFLAKYKIKCQMPPEVTVKNIQVAYIEEDVLWLVLWYLSHIMFPVSLS